MVKDLEEIVKSAGFKLSLTSEEVTDEYALKWGYGLAIKEFIQKTMLIGMK